MARVLIADDEPAVREFLVRALESRGHEAAAVADGVAALGALEGKEFDLLLSDIIMPELDGIALALKVAKERPDMPIVLMTGFADQRRRARNLEALVRDVVAKPFSLEQICAIVDDALRASATPRD